MLNSTYERMSVPQNRVSIRWVIVFYLIFLLSLPLPAIGGLVDPSSTGAKPASGFSILFKAPLLIAAMPLVLLAEPGLIVVVFLPILTSATLMLPLFLSISRRFGLVCGVSIGLLSIIAVACISSEATGEKHIGYIVWWIAQLGLIVSCGLALWQIHLETETDLRRASENRM